MTELQEKAMRMALKALDAYSWEQVDAAKQALLQALAQPEQEPVFRIPNAQSPFKADPLNNHTAPPKRDWVGLTDADLPDGACSVCGLKGVNGYVCPNTACPSRITSNASVKPIF